MVTSTCEAETGLFLTATPKKEKQKRREEKKRESKREYDSERKASKRERKSGKADFFVCF